MPKGAVEEDAPAVRAARKFGAGVAEIYWDGNQIQLDLKENGKHLKPKQPVVDAEADDIAVPTNIATADGSLYYILAERLVVLKVHHLLVESKCSRSIDTSESYNDNEEYCQHI